MGNNKSVHINNERHTAPKNQKIGNHSCSILNSLSCITNKPEDAKPEDAKPKDEKMSFEEEPVVRSSVDTKLEDAKPKDVNMSFEEKPVVISSAKTTTAEKKNKSKTT